jgi:nitrate reductase beta subunit
MFGPGVDEAIEKYTNPDKKLFGLLRLFGTTETIISRFRVEDAETIGYDEAGSEVARVGFDEPMYIRQPYDAQLDADRFNEP